MFETVQGLLLSQQYPAFDLITPEGLPQYGYLASDSATPIAVGFLRMVEGGYAQLDTLVSNKDLSSDMRHEGITEVVDALMRKAKELKLKGILAFSNDLGVLARATVLGFKIIPQTIIAMPL